MKGGRGILETQMWHPSDFPSNNSLHKMNHGGDLAQRGHAPCYEWKSTDSEIPDWQMNM